LGAKVEAFPFGFQVVRTPNTAIPTPQAATSPKRHTSDIYSVFICRRIDCAAAWMTCRIANNSNDWTIGKTIGKANNRSGFQPPARLPE